MPLSINLSSTPLKYPFYADTHEWSGGLMNCCVNCGGFWDTPTGLEVCTYKLDGVMETCCDCGDEYPRRELLLGEVYCSKCREADRLRAVK